MKWFKILRQPIRAWRETLSEDDKLHVILGGVILALVVGISVMIYSSSKIADKATEMKTHQDASVEAAKAKAAEAERIAKNTTKELRETKEALAENTKLNKELWEAFKKSNPKSPLAIPQVVEPTPEASSGYKRRKPEVIILPAPKLTVKPPKAKRIYVTKPKDWPWWKSWPPKSPTPKPRKSGR